jgi:hypothetical protein
MANYDFYGSGESTAVAGIKRMNFSTPGDTSTVTLRRGRVDGTKQTISSSSDVARVFPVYAGEIILGVWIKVDTVETTANCAIEIGIDGGATFGTDILITGANFVQGNITGDHVASDGNLTINANNGEDIDTGIINITAMIAKDFDYIGPTGR